MKCARTAYAVAVSAAMPAVVTAVIGVLANPVHADLVLDFPSPDAETSGPTGDGELGEGGGGVHFFTGDTLAETFLSTGHGSTTASRWVFDMDDWTDAGAQSSFDLLINGVTVGSFDFTGEGIHSTVRSFDLTFEHEGPILGMGAGADDFELRIVATTTVPFGMGSWNWIAGGEVTLETPVPAPGALAALVGFGLGCRRRRRG